MKELELWKKDIKNELNRLNTQLTKIAKTWGTNSEAYRTAEMKVTTFVEHRITDEVFRRGVYGETKVIVSQKLIEAMSHGKNRTNTFELKRVKEAVSKERIIMRGIAENAQYSKETVTFGGQEYFTEQNYTEEERKRFLTQAKLNPSELKKYVAISEVSQIRQTKWNKVAAILYAATREEMDSVRAKIAQQYFDMDKNGELREKMKQSPEEIVKEYDAFREQHRNADIYEAYMAEVRKEKERIKFYPTMEELRKQWGLDE